MKRFLASLLFAPGVFAPLGGDVKVTPTKVGDRLVEVSAAGKDLSDYVEKFRARTKEIDVTYLSIGQGEPDVITVAEEGYTWKKLPGATFKEKIAGQAKAHPKAIMLSAPLKFPRGELLVETFNGSGCHACGPSLSVLHLLDATGESAGRAYHLFPGSFGATADTFSVVTLDEPVLRHESGFTGQGQTISIASYYRIDWKARSVAAVGLYEFVSDNTGACDESGNDQKLPECEEESFRLSGKHPVFTVTHETAKWRGKSAHRVAKKPAGECRFAGGKYRCPEALVKAANP